MNLRVGRYETLRPIASGGMATVYLGRALGAGGFERLVAIKVMHPHTAAEPEFVAMFLDEARLAARVRHPNVVATIDLVEDPLFLVMDYVEGPSLYHLLRTAKKLAKRPLPLDITLRIFLDVLAGLHAAHDLTGSSGEPLHLVHRDVSPQNVLVGADGISRITDFGVARAESRLSSTRGPALKGKIAYMSPEQIRAEPIDRRSDVYAAGVVLWEMLTGQRLFVADNEGAMLGKILSGPSGGPKSIDPTVPSEIDQVCLQALRNNPAERYPSAAAFAEAVEHAAAAARVTIATSRAVAALIDALGLKGQPPEMETAPSTHGTPNTARSALVAPVKPVVPTASLGALADMLEPPTHALEGPTRQLDGPTRQLDGPTRQLDGLTRQYEGPTRQIDGPNSELDPVGNAPVSAGLGAQGAVRRPEAPDVDAGRSMGQPAREPEPTEQLPDPGSAGTGLGVEVAERAQPRQLFGSRGLIAALVVLVVGGAALFVFGGDEGSEPSPADPTQTAATEDAMETASPVKTAESAAAARTAAPQETAAPAESTAPAESAAPEETAAPQAPPRRSGTHVGSRRGPSGAPATAPTRTRKPPTGTRPGPSPTNFRPTEL